MNGANPNDWNKDCTCEKCRKSCFGCDNQDLRLTDACKLDPKECVANNYKDYRRAK